MSIWGHIIIVMISMGIAYLSYRYLKAKDDGCFSGTGRMTFSAWMMIIGLSYFIIYTGCMLFQQKFL